MWKSRIIIFVVKRKYTLYIAYSDTNIDKVLLSLNMQIYLLLFTTNVFFLESNLTTWSYYSYSTTEEVKAKTCAHNSGFQETSQETWVKGLIIVGNDLLFVHKNQFIIVHILLLNIESW